MVQQSREPFLLLGFRSLLYALKSRRHACPALFAVEDGWIGLPEGSELPLVIDD
jgi:hypothetical protein